MVSKTVLVTLILALVASSYARPGSSEEYPERKHHDDKNIMSKTITIRYYNPYEERSHYRHQEDAEKYVKNSGKIHSCDEVEDDKPCVVEEDYQKKNKKVTVQDTSSEEYDVTDKKFIKALLSQEEIDTDLKHGQKTPVHQGRWAHEHSYKDARHNVQQRRQYGDFEEALSYGHVEEDSQERRNKLHKH